ncbi:MAG: ABC transporter permease [Bacteroidota bacterium]|nr:ABC transporter permease [Bacteroidota bacterium]
MIFLKIFYESLKQAGQQLTSNKLRSFLTLLGITIGIFCVIAVLSAVDSLEDNVMQSFEKLGNDVLYIDKWPWHEDPGKTYWKYMDRPNPGYDDLMAIQKKSSLTEAAAVMVFVPGKTIKYLNNYVEGAYMAGVTEEYNQVIKLEFEEGAYFTTHDFIMGKNQLLLGNDLARELFPNLNCIGKQVRLNGENYSISGVIKKEGKSLINIMNFDEAVILPWGTIKKIVHVSPQSKWGTLLSIKAKKGVDLDELRYELSSIIRPVRGLKPKETDNFSINALSLLTNLVSGIFGVLNVAGFVIGLFSMLVGAFGVANIMFVSVKERTSIIGVKMALGAKRHFILWEYLLEAIILCIIGGLVGLALVWLILTVVSQLISFPVYVSMGNVLLGLSLSIIIGLIAGIAPAYQASKMDPVEAIRR